MQKAYGLLFSLVKSVIFKSEPESYIKEEITLDTLKELFKLSQSHSIANIVAHALIENKIINKDNTTPFYQAMMVSLINHERMNYELKRTSELFEEYEIYHIPLKGAVLKSYYPEPWMRTSSDIDILIKKDDLEKATSLLVDKLGYRLHLEDAHDRVFITPSNTSLELHFKLIEDHLPNGKVRYKWNVGCLNNVWETAAKKNGRQYCLDMSDELFYFYHIAHMAKHFERSGCGIRFFIDLWILNHKMKFDKALRDNLLEASGLKKFEECMVSLSEVWFSNGEKTSFLKTIEAYILKGGIYGNVDNYVEVKNFNSGGKVRYVLAAVFLSLDTLKKVYPILEKHRWLYPFCQIARWFKILLPKKTKDSRTANLIKKSILKKEDKDFSVSDIFEELNLGEN